MIAHDQSEHQHRFVISMSRRFRSPWAGHGPIRANIGQRTWWELWNIVMARLDRAIG
jgi:hypothetical protein